MEFPRSVPRKPVPASTDIAPLKLTSTPRPRPLVFSKSDNPRNRSLISSPTGRCCRRDSSLAQLYAQADASTKRLTTAKSGCIWGTSASMSGSQGDAEKGVPDGLVRQQRNSEDAPAELSVVVDELLNGLSAKFATVSAEIFTKIDDMSRRLDNLESTIQAGNESSSTK